MGGMFFWGFFFWFWMSMKREAETVAPERAEKVDSYFAEGKQCGLNLQEEKGGGEGNSEIQPKKKKIE